MSIKVVKKQNNYINIREALSSFCRGDLTRDETYDTIINNINAINKERKTQLKNLLKNLIEII